jgi:Type ISP C-terminal specificity domain
LRIAIAWPHIPLPKTKEALDRSKDHGKRIADLLDAATGVAGVTTGTLQEHYRVMGILSATDLRVTAGWGHKDSKGRVNPGKGKIETRSYSEKELMALRSGAESIGMSEAQLHKLLGPPVDVYLNAETCWRCVPSAAWDYTIGGYQVMKKWLSYREENLIGRPLLKDEAREVTSMVRRLSALVIMTDQLNENYLGICGSTYDWPVIEEE